MNKKAIPTEHIEQALLFKWAMFSSGKYPELENMFAIPNGGYYGLFVEMKRTSGGRVSESQQKFLKTLNDNGYLAVVCKGFEQAQEAILKYLNKGVRK